jgi:hypothetical protein
LVYIDKEIIEVISNIGLSFEYPTAVSFPLKADVRSDPAYSGLNRRNPPLLEGFNAIIQCSAGAHWRFNETF